MSGRIGVRIRGSAPSTGWYAVLALALVAALGAATVVGAGLSLWRGTAAQRAIGVPQQPLVRPGAGVVTVPAAPSGPLVARPHARPHATTPIRNNPVASPAHVASVVSTHAAASRGANHQPGTVDSWTPKTVAQPVTPALSLRPVMLRLPHLRLPTWRPARLHTGSVPALSLRARVRLVIASSGTAATVVNLCPGPARVGGHLLVTQVPSGSDVEDD